MSKPVFHDVAQGSEEWHKLRAEYHGASTAQVMMGEHPSITRSEMVKMMALGTEKEFSDWVLNVLFERGHELEAIARPIIEGRIGTELYPTTVTRNVDGIKLLASLDGQTMCGSILWECKTANQSLIAALDGGNGSVPQTHYWQLEQQLLVTGADKAIFTITDGTEEGTVSVDYKPVEGRAEQLLRGWAQFFHDVENYEHVPEMVKPVGQTMENLPAIHVDIKGEVTASNLADWKSHVIAVVQSHRKELVTDQDFADAHKRIKWCEDLEKKIIDAKQQALSQSASVAETLAMFDEIHAEVRDLRLHDQKQYKAEQDNRKAEILNLAREAVGAHYSGLQKQLPAGYVLRQVDLDLASAVRGKRTLETYQGAAQDEVAKVCIALTGIYDELVKSIAIIEQYANSEYAGLFADRATLATQPSETVKALCEGRIAQHKEQIAEQARQALEKERQDELKRLELIELAKKREAEEAEAKAKALAEQEAKKAEQVEQIHNPDIGAFSGHVSAGDVSVQVHQSEAAKLPEHIKTAMQEFKQVPIGTYNHLLKSDSILNALMSFGVENWDGYDAAMQAVEKGEF